MSDITVVSRVQRIIVEPSSQTVSVASTGQRGLTGPTGPQGPTGPTGATGPTTLRTGTAFPTSPAPYNGEMVFRTDLYRPFIWSSQYNEWMPAFTNKAVLRKVGNASSTTTSTAYVDWPAAGVLSLPFVKHANATDLLLTVTGCGYINVASGFIHYGVRILTTDHDIVSSGVTLNNRSNLTAEKAILSIAKGNLTVKLRARVALSSTTLTSDVNDIQSVSIEEVWPQSPAQ